MKTEDQRDADRPSAGVDREAVARIIDPVKWGVHDHYINVAEPYEFLDRADPLGIQFRATANEAVAESLAKADAILALAPTDRVAELGEEFIEFKEALADIRSLRKEHSDLNGGGHGWSKRHADAWARVDELFANEDEAAWERQQESLNG